MGFPDALREKLLLWCDRHCCLCKKACGPLIDVHHIRQKADGGEDTEDNAIPLCFDCHGIVGHYNAQHPKGNKFSVRELQARREQVYDEFTRHLVPSIEYKVTQAGRAFPNVGFFVGHLGGGPPVKLDVNVAVYLGTERVPGVPTDPLYLGKVRWNLNPLHGVSGHLTVPGAAAASDAQLAVCVRVVVWDVYDRSHILLPASWVFDREVDDWWFDPVDEDGLFARARRSDGTTGR